VAVLPGAVVLPGVELCPAVPELPDGAVLPPDGELCAATHAPQHRITESNVSFLIDFIVTSHPYSWIRILNVAHKVVATTSLSMEAGLWRVYPED
jgi:hypothetical protein